MGQLVSIIGNTGVGKTTLAHALCATGQFVAGLEQHAERPFQALFAGDLQRYALANQMDYMLLRAEQEEALRHVAGTGVVDGGLDQDFFVFTRLFDRRGYLSGAEYELCDRLYRRLRRLLPAPDLFIHLTAPIEVLTERFLARHRTLEIARVEDVPLIDELLTDWLTREQPQSLLTLDAAADHDGFRRRMPNVLAEIDRRLHPSARSI
jgi:deoxyadenosine/deoxycytidine kinase